MYLKQCLASRKETIQLRWLQKLFPRFDKRVTASYKRTVAIPQGPFYELFGLKLAEARQRANITQEALSKAVGLSRTSIVNIEKGRQPVLLHVVAKIAATLGIAPALLIPDASVITAAELPPDLGKVSERNRPWVERIFNSRMQKERGREAKVRSGASQSGGTSSSSKRQKDARSD